jgi:hypothetical protein
MEPCPDSLGLKGVSIKTEIATITKSAGTASSIRTGTA